MLVWINGPFGVGKTQTAFELHRRLAGSVVCDPEEIGYGLHRTLPPALRGDFQDLQAWRDGVVETLDLALQRHDGVILAPMTVTDRTYFAQTVGRLRDRGHDVRHFSLLARRGRRPDRGVVRADAPAEHRRPGMCGTPARGVGLRHVRFF